jgi:hypothetical protein
MKRPPFLADPHALSQQINMVRQKNIGIIGKLHIKIDHVASACVWSIIHHAQVCAGIG